MRPRANRAVRRRLRLPLAARRRPRVSRRRGYASERVASARPLQPADRYGVLSAWARLHTPRRSRLIAAWMRIMPRTSLTPYPYFLCSQPPSLNVVRVRKACGPLCSQLNEGAALAACDMFPLGLIAFELFHAFGSAMERAKLFSQLRSQASLHSYRTPRTSVSVSHVSVRVPASQHRSPARHARPRHGLYGVCPHRRRQRNRRTGEGLEHAGREAA